MSRRLIPTLRKQNSPSPASSLLQRKGTDWEKGQNCAECQQNEGVLQRRAVNQTETDNLSLTARQGRRSPESGVNLATSILAEPALGQQPKRTKTPSTPLMVQAKLVVGQPNDKYEQEADRVADQVMRMPEPKVQRQPELDEDEDRVDRLQSKPLVSQITPLVQRQEATEEMDGEEESEEEPTNTQEETEENTPQTLQRQEKDEKNVQAKRVSGRVPKISANVEHRIQARRGNGFPLSDSTRVFFESRFGADFSGVRVHTDTEANSLSGEINARAFTVGKDIFLGSGRYNPDTRAGRQLLAHELTHTVQQGASLQRKLNISSVRITSIQRRSNLWSRFKKGVGALKAGARRIKARVKQRLGFFKAAALQKLKQGLNLIAKGTIQGYKLLNVVLGENLITGKKIKRSGINIIQGYMELTIPPVVGSVLFSQLKETKTLPKAGKWVEGKVIDIGIDFNDISRRLKLMWKDLLLRYRREGNFISFYKNLSPVFGKFFLRYFGPVIGKVLAFTSVVMEKVKELRFEGALRLVGATKLLDALKKDPKAFKKAVDNPKAILKQFMKEALKKGFSKFKENFLGHFKTAVLSWLFGKKDDMKIEMPKKLDPAGLFHVVAQLLGITKLSIKESIIKKLKPNGEKIVALLEKTSNFAKDLFIRGPITMWHRVKNQLSSFKDKVKSEIATSITVEVVKKAVEKLVTMLNPVGALVQLVRTLYGVIKFFLDNWETIKSVAIGILNSIAMVALSQTDAAVKSVVTILTTGLKLMIDFLARVLNLGSIVKKVKAAIDKIGNPVRKARDKVVNWIVNMGKKLFGKAKKVAKKVKAKLVEWWTIRKKFKSIDGRDHQIYFLGKGNRAKLMVASAVPVSIEEWVKERRKSTAKPNRKQEQALDLALGTKAKIDKLTAGKKNTNYKTLKSKIEAELIKLAEHLKNGGISTGRLPLTKVTYRMQGSKAKMVLADPLTMNPGNTKGSTPTADPDGWSSHIKTIPDYKNHYVRLHLLNHLLHGPGNAVWNLTPGKKSENTQMEIDVENPAWQLMRQGKILWYKSEITKYRSEAGFEDFAEGIRVSYGYKEGNKNIAPKPKTFPVTQPDPKHKRMPPSLDTMSSKYAERELDYVVGASMKRIIDARPKSKYKTWKKFEKVHAVKNELHKYPNLIDNLKKNINRKKPERGKLLDF